MFNLEKLHTSILYILWGIISCATTMVIRMANESDLERWQPKCSHNCYYFPDTNRDTYSCLCDYELDILTNTNFIGKYEYIYKYNLDN
jgi:hypothetical protein